MEDYVSIKWIADELHVSKQTVRYHLKKFPDSVRKDEDGKTVIPAEIAEKLRARIGGKEVVNNDPFTGKEVVNDPGFTGKKPEKSGNFTGKEVVKDDSFTGKEEESAIALTLEILRQQLATKDAQIAEKDRQIAQLSAQLSDTTEALKAAQRAQEAAQALHAGTMAQLQEVTQNAPVEAEPVAEDEDPEEAEQRRRGFWSWILRGKRG